MVTEGDETLHGKHTVECTDVVLQSCTPETYIILLTNVTLIKLILKDMLWCFDQLCTNIIILMILQSRRNFKDIESIKI